jgi:putative radical SAM enzyme (TIGR03279 family)
MAVEVKKYKNEVEENEEFRLSRNEKSRMIGGLAQEKFVHSDLTRQGVEIAEIEPDSVAAELGLQSGDRLLEINGEKAKDILQLKRADLGEVIELKVLQNGEISFFDIEKDISENIGIGVNSELFDGVTRCTNKCPFCFVDQLPPRVKGGANLRRTLYVRDDDYRLSFLHGHYITLTNLKDEDYARIIEEKLSPLCVSVHATDKKTREFMVGNPKAGEILDRIDYLIANGITINTQIVFCPEVNDGAILEKSIRDLMDRAPGVESMAVVPAGLTKFLPPNRGLRVTRPDEARAVLEMIKPFQKEAKKRLGVQFVYASDEMYLLAGQEMPKASHYDGFPQYANGVGMIRSFQDDVQKIRRKPERQKGRAPKITLVTGSLAAPVMRELAEVLREKNWADAQVAEIRNTFWGGNVGCAGLIMAQEIVAQLAGMDIGEMMFLPPDAVDKQNRMLDDITLDTLAQKFSTHVRCDANGPLQLTKILAAL